MVDIPGDSSTTQTIAVGGIYNGSIESGGDHDWIAVTLSAGQSISVALDGLGTAALSDPYLRIRDSSGNLLFEDDDGGPGNNALLGFKATYSGVYYIDVSSWEDTTAGATPLTGDYQLRVSPYMPPPVGTVQQIATQLTNDYWGGSSHHFAVSQGGSITVNLSALSADGQFLAREALKVWSDVIGVGFPEVASGGQIVFSNDQDGASTGANWSRGIETSAHVNVSTQWLTNYGTTINTYAFQTFIHEIGHALGLGHAGDYNGDARFPFDARFINDAWSLSVMSYFSPTQNTYFSGQGFTRAYVGTPMQADILAVSKLYGLSTTTRLGDTVYGFNSNAGNDIYNANLYPTISYTVFDSGGTDTLDFSGFGGAQTIDLHSGSFSNVLGKVGNVSIAIGTVIENAIGGSGNDIINGNDFANVLVGGAGSDGLFGFGGDDTLFGGPGDDSLVGGDGFDTANYSDSAAGIVVQGQTIDSPGNSAGFGSDRIFDIERVVGSAFNDVYNGTGLDERFDGGAGNDTFNGGPGNDTFYSGSGADTFVGGPGADTLIDTRANLNGDTFVDFASDDRIVFTDANVSTFSFSLTGATLNYSGGTLFFGSAPAGALTTQANPGGGVALFTTASTFGNPNFRLAAFGTAPSAGGWTSDSQYLRVLGDVNRDRSADIVGFGESGVFVSFANGDGSFLAPALVLSAFGSGALVGGWGTADQAPRVVADINGDQRADIVGFGNNGVYVSLALDNFGNFAAPVLALGTFGSSVAAGSWTSEDRFPRLFGDVNGDGFSDIVAFGQNGTYVSLATGNGGFSAPVLALAYFGASAAAGGWTSNALTPRVLADVNGDKRVDIVAFGASGVSVALAIGDGGFSAPTLKLTQFGSALSAGGWTSNNLFPREVADVNHDGFADIVGFGNNGVFVSYGQADGGFGVSFLASTAFGASAGAGGWSSEDRFPRHLADINHDGSFDIVGFGISGVYTALSTFTGF